MAEILAMKQDERQARPVAASLEGGVLRLTPEGWLLLDRLAVDFAAADPARAAQD